ncbi:hypothetical protein BDR05DRAFT_98262 [Suillus weaverae]|nr:hypothetical protein BDR05DRAFT_98262 [Suillus weaverae]
MLLRTASKCKSRQHVRSGMLHSMYGRRTLLFRLCILFWFALLPSTTRTRRTRQRYTEAPQHAHGGTQRGLAQTQVYELQPTHHHEGVRNAITSICVPFPRVQNYSLSVKLFLQCLGL